MSNLEKEISDLEGRLKSIDTNIKSTHKTMLGKSSELEGIKARKQELTDKRVLLNRELNNLKKTISVSEHAILRYAQRVLNIELDDIVDDVVKEKIFEVDGNGEFVVDYTDGSTHKFIVKEYSIVTII